MKRSSRLAVLYLAATTFLAVGSFPLATIPVSAQDDVLIGYSSPELVGAQREIQQGLVAQADAQKQFDDINNYIAQQVDAIVAVPFDSTAICSAVEAATEANIPFYTIDRPPIGCALH